MVILGFMCFCDNNNNQTFHNDSINIIFGQREHAITWRETGSEVKFKPNMRMEKERERHMIGKETGDGEQIGTQQVANILLYSPTHLAYTHSATVQHTDTH